MSLRLQALTEAVAASFNSAGFSPAELLQGQIIHTDLVWQAPPLKSSAMLRTLPFSDYIDSPVSVNSAKLYEFYALGIFNLHSAPQEMATAEGFKSLTHVMPGAGQGERKLALPLPEGWPVWVTETGPMFALDCAHLFRTSGVCKGFLDDENNYCAQTEWGDVGILEGRVTIAAEWWDMDCSGFVQSLLERPRGFAYTDCHYDLVARLRSALHETPERFREFEGTDLGLQALRIWADGETFKPLITALRNMPAEAFKRRAKIAAYKQALETMQSWSIQDRTKISVLMEIFIPTYMTLEKFARKILDPRKIIPSTLSRATENRILGFLKNQIGALEHVERATRAD